jgi:hypothetical protein
MNSTTEGLKPADVIFGNPNRNCAGQGICKVTSPQMLSNCACLSTKAWIRNNSHKQDLSFYFSKDLLPQAIREIYFEGNIFIVEQELKLDLHLLNLGTKIIQLRKGFYKISKSNDQDFWIVSIAYRVCDRSNIQYSNRAIATTQESSNLS